MAEFEKVGRYEILERIGVGSFTVAYHGRDTFSHREVAIKICIAQEEHLRTGFLRLAEIASSLRHPNIVSVLEFGSGEGKPYLVEDYVPGDHLGWMIEAQQPIPWVKRLDFLTQVAQGLRYAHQQGVLHRHVSPRCIRIQDGTQAKISDFGIRQLASASARLADPRGHSETEGYLAPEQALGLRADGRTDIFYFGALAYELLTFESPFAGNNLTDFLRRVLDTSDDATIARLRRLPEGIARILRRCLQRDPSDRYEDFSGVLDDLRPILEKERIRARSSSVDPPSPDDTQELPGPEADDAGDSHLELATEYMVGPPHLKSREDVKPALDDRRPETLEETLPGIPAPEPAAPEDLESTVHLADAEASSRSIPPPPEPRSPGVVAPAAVPATDAPSPGGEPAPAPETRHPSVGGKADPKTAAPPKKPPALRRWLLVAALGGVLVAGLVLATSVLSGGRSQPEDAAPAVPLPAPPPRAPAPAPAGSLFVDAVPWGEVVEIVGPEGTPLPLPAEAFTPLHLSLAPGDYQIEISHPDAEETWICEVRIQAGGNGVCRGEFELVDVLEYFKETGWWR